jgi:flavin reductase (DIM6/NTAB) family NADH-FMN oxidoreductase RutF
MEPVAFDARAFRNALSSFPTGVAVITTIGADGLPVGLTCNSFSSVSLDPPLVSWGLRLNSKNLQAFQRASAFAINILAEDQTELSGRFAKSGDPKKFEGVGWKTGHAGVPVINDCVASFECAKFAEHLAGDHVLFLGQVHAFNQGREEHSLVFYKGAYMMLTRSLRELASSGPMQGERLHEARRLIHGMLLRLASERAGEDDLHAIDRNLEEIERLVAPEDRDRRAQASLEFFHLIAKASHNDVLVVVSESLTTVLRHVVKATGSAVTFRPELVPLRKAILERLRARDAAGAERQMNALLDQLSHVPAGDAS